MTRLRLSLGMPLSILVATAVTASAAFPSRIDLPDGSQPEGIAIGGTHFFTGSIPTGAVYRGDLVTGQGAMFVPPRRDARRSA